jgi:hypothetical protein
MIQFLEDISGDHTETPVAVNPAQIACVRPWCYVDAAGKYCTGATISGPGLWVCVRLSVDEVVTRLRGAR